MTRPAATRSHRRGVARSLGGARRATRPADTVDSADEPAHYPRWWRHLGWPLVTVVVGTAAMLIGGVPAWRAVAIVLAAAVAVWALAASLVAPQPEWPYELPPDVRRASSVWQVSGLVGATESDAAFHQFLRPRLWALTVELLRRRGIDPDSQRAVELVGPREYALLTGADTDPRHVTASVPTLCHTVARLAVQPAPGSKPAITNPALAGLAGAPRGAGNRGRKGRPA